MSKDANKEICKIININEDAREFYQEAQEKAENTTVKGIFKDFENLHQGVIINLQNHVRQNGGDPEADETFVGEVAEMWGKLRATLSPNTDESLIASLEEAEDRCIHSIKEAIANDDLPAEARSVLKREEATLQKSHDYMKIMKDNVNAAA